MYQVFFRPTHCILSRFHRGALPATFVMMILIERVGTEDIVQNWTMGGFSWHFWAEMIK